MWRFRCNSSRSFLNSILRKKKKGQWTWFNYLEVVSRLRGNTLWLEKAERESQPWRGGRKRVNMEHFSKWLVSVIEFTCYDDGSDIENNTDRLQETLCNSSATECRIKSLERPIFKLRRYPLESPRKKIPRSRTRIILSAQILNRLIRWPYVYKVSFIMKAVQRKFITLSPTI